MILAGVAQIDAAVASPHAAAVVAQAREELTHHLHGRLQALVDQTLVDQARRERHPTFGVRRLQSQHVEHGPFHLADSFEP